MSYRRLCSVVPVLLLLTLVACSKTGEPAQNAAASTLAVTLVPATQQQMQRTVVVSGPVTAWEEMQLGVELSGARITALHVDVGQQVRKGEVLLQLDHRALDAELAQARASLNEAEAALGLAQANVRRAEPLAAQKLISAAQLDELRAARVQAEARVGTARAGRDSAQLRRDFADLRAPADGVISKRLVQPGQVVGAGSELLRLIRDGRLEWRAELAEAELAQVGVGATVLLPSAEGVVEGTVRAVSPGVDGQTRTGTLHADLPQPGSLKAGSYVEGRIAIGTGSVLTVPAASIVQRDGHPYVFTVDDKGIAHRLRVSTGTSEQGQVEIVQGLKAGQQVVEEGAGFLGDGDRVRVVPADAAAAKDSGA